MRIGVVGAGAVGGLLAALLDRAGHEVAVTARGEHLARIRAEGLLLDGAYGTYRARVLAGRMLPAPPELAVVAVKAQDAAEAVRADAAAIAGVPVVVVQNGLGGAAALADLLPASPLVGALTMIASSHLRPGVVTATARGGTLLGAARASAADVAGVAAVLGGVLPVRTVPDLVAAQWSKLVVNQLNAGSALTGLPAQRAFADPGLRRAIAAAMAETLQVARGLGVRPAGVVPDLVAAALRTLPPERGQRIVRRMVAAMGPVPNPGSTLQSIRRGRPTEIDELAGAVVRGGRAAGVPTPVSERIVALVHEVERTGSFLPPDVAGWRLLAP